MGKLITIEQLECLRCGHKWLPRENRKPTLCPKCHNVGWDKPRRNPLNNKNGKA